MYVELRKAARGSLDDLLSLDGLGEHCQKLLSQFDGERLLSGLQCSSLYGLDLKSLVGFTTDTQKI